MQKSLILFAALVAAVLANPGPTVPYGGFTIDDCPQENYFVVDAENMCWFHQCVMTADEDNNDQMSLLPRPCALGSKVSYNFVNGETNPCTINFDDTIGYDCVRSRPSVAGPPECFSDGSFECLNGGTLTYESNLCWCLCTTSWDGNWNCDRPTIPIDQIVLPPASNICVDGEPLQDWCAESPCLGGGTCYNQCDTHWCECANRDTIDHWGKNCENRPQN